MLPDGALIQNTTVWFEKKVVNIQYGIVTFSWHDPDEKSRFDLLFLSGFFY